MSTLKKFLQGCVTVVDGLGEVQRAIDDNRRGRPHGHRNVIDARVVSEHPVPQRTPAGVPVPQVPGAYPQAQPGQITARHAQVRTIEQRVAYIVEQVQKGRLDPKVREAAVKAISRKCGKDWCVPEGNYEKEVVAVFMALRESYRYCMDAYGVDVFQRPGLTLDFGGGDCDDATILVCSALGSIGYPTKARVVRTKGHDDWNHIYALVGLPPKAPAKWVPLDLSVSNQPAGWQPPRTMVVAYKDFEIPPTR